MKLLFSSASQAEVGLLKGMLDAAAIKSEIRNESAQAAYYPGVEFYPELSVLNDEEFPRAMELRDAWRTAPSGDRKGWICPRCGEHLEGQFLGCWKCGAKRDEPAGDAPSSSR
jgi:Putative prokaryotic signal transducing protein